MARDVERYLAGDPVEACPPSGWYRLRKVARRHRVILTTTVLVAGALIGGTTVSVWQALNARRAKADALVQRDRAREAEAEARTQRDRAETNFRRAWDAVDEMLTEVSEQALAHIPQAEPLRHGLLVKAAAFYRDVVSERSPDPTLRYESASSFSRLGGLESDLGRHPEAARAYRQQIAALGELLHSDAAHVGYLRDLFWARLRLAGQQKSLGDLTAAAEEMDRAVTIAQGLVDRFPSSAVDQILLARGLDYRGVLEQKAGHLSDAKRLHNRSLSVYRALRPIDGDRFPAGGLIGALNNLAVVAATEGKHDEAISFLRMAIDEHGRDVGAESKSLQRRSFLRNLHENLAIELATCGKPSDALQTAR